MQRIEYDHYGGPEVMCLREFQPRPLRAHEVLVRVKAAAINPVDWKVRQGLMRVMTGRRFPRAMGTEFAGVVEAVGPRVQRLRPGDAVFGAVPLRESGSFAGQVVTSEKLVALRPPAIADAQAACLSVAPVAAWRGLAVRAGVRPGQQVFVAGCAGAVGRAAVQIARLRGAHVAGSCGATDLQAMATAGVDPVLDYRRDVPATLEGRFDVVFDTAGQLPLARAFELLAPGGCVLDLNMTPARMLRGLLTSRYRLVFAAQTASVLETLAGLVVTGHLKIDVGRTAPLSQAIELIAHVEQGGGGPGRSVILMD